MINKKRWTAKEDSLLVLEVKNSPTNLKAAFLSVSKKLNRTASACSYRWYKVLSKDKNNACFITISGKHSSLNRKNGSGNKCTNSLFMRVLKVLGIIK